MAPSLFTAVGAAAVALAAQASATVSSKSQSYQVTEVYDSSNFFDKFTFSTAVDANGGYVSYQNRDKAESLGLVKYDDGEMYIGVEHSETGSARKSVRLESQTEYNKGLIIADFSYLPKPTCGAWPAFWFFGEPWPTKGEVDIYENWNNLEFNRHTAHVNSPLTIGSCEITGTDMTATVDSVCISLAPVRTTKLHTYRMPTLIPLRTQPNCWDFAANQWNYQGCSASHTTETFGSSSGGVFAMEWTSEHIKIWDWTHSAVPNDITTGKPKPDTWKTPAYAIKQCDIDKAFTDMKMIFNIDLCGVAAHDDKWGASCKAETKYDQCYEYVRDEASDFKDSYFKVKHINIFQLKDDVVSTSSAVISSTSSTTSSARSSTTSSARPSTTSSVRPSTTSSVRPSTTSSSAVLISSTSSSSSSSSAASSSAASSSRAAVGSTSASVSNSTSTFSHAIPSSTLSAGVTSSYVFTNSSSTSVAPSSTSSSPAGGDDDDDDDTCDDDEDDDISISLTRSATASATLPGPGSLTYPVPTTTTTQAPEEMTTSTIYTTSVHTVTSCPPTVHDCPAGGYVTTEIISIGVTVCPVTATATGSSSPQPTTTIPTIPSGYTTRTVEVTKTYTITSCKPTVTNCPVGSVTTEVSVTTTVGPIGGGGSNPPVASKPAVTGAQTDVEKATTTTTTKSVSKPSDVSGGSGSGSGSNNNGKTTDVDVIITATVVPVTYTAKPGYNATMSTSVSAPQGTGAGGCTGTGCGGGGGGSLVEVSAGVQSGASLALVVVAAFFIFAL
ncbi:hypothetical protein F4778DRAFT_158388 [Xylariomycetidae sp. FL2044]|nr:hypothetical protein F4778DRAFT_158388 [Xylariomycetidae sp. FL2044]